MPNLPVLLFGLLAGALLSILRAPLGLDLTQLPAADAVTSAAYRAAALALVGLTIWRGGRLFRAPVPIGWLLLGLIAGFLGHGLWLQSWIAPTTRLGFALAATVATLGLHALGSRPREVPQQPDRPAPSERASTRSLIGLAIAGAGVALALESGASRVRLLGLGLERDDTVFAATALLIVWLGYITISRRAAARLPNLGLVLLPLTAVAVLVTLELVGRIANPDTAWSLARRFKLTLEDPGKFTWNSLIAARTLFVPTLLFGAALNWLGDSRKLAALVAGAAAGIFAHPALVHAGAAALGVDELREASPAASRVAVGACVAAGGIALATIPSPRVAIASLLLGAAAWLLPHSRALPFSPWYQVAIEPMLTVDAAVGLLTVEHDRVGTAIATLDRKRLTPTADQEPLDRLAIIQSLAARHPNDQRGVLFIGQLTPARSTVFAQAGLTHIDRTAPWHRHMAAVEAALFADNNLPAGALLDPIDARAKVERGEYSLVIAAPTHGPLLRPSGGSHLTYAPPPTPATHAIESHPNTPVVAWIDSSAALERRALPERVMLAGSGLFDIRIGLASTAARANLPSVGKRAPLWLEPGPAQRAEWPWSWLNLRALVHGDAARQFTFERMADNETGSESSRALARGLAMQYGAQIGPGRGDSPFRSRTDDIWVAPGSIELLARGASGREPGELERYFFEGVAELLLAKRLPEELYSNFPPVAEAGAPWPALERAVGLAAAEFGITGEAADWLDRAAKNMPYNIGVLLESAEALERDGRYADSAERLEQVLDIQSGRPGVQRRLAIARVRAGDSRGKKLVRQLLEEDPDDLELAAFLGDEPYPEAEPGWSKRLAQSPEESSHEGHDEHESHDDH